MSPIRVELALFFFYKVLVSTVFIELSSFFLYALSVNRINGVVEFFFYTVYVLIASKILQGSRHAFNFRSSLPGQFSDQAVLPV